MSRIQLSDTTMDVVAKMSDGNPGALAALMEIMTGSAAIDPQGSMGGLGAILLLDTFKIYGTDIYVLFSDICERKLNKMLAVIRACQLGLFDPDLLAVAASRQDYSGRDIVPVEDLYSEVCKQLDQFDKQPA